MLVSELHCGQLCDQMCSALFPLCSVQPTWTHRTGSSRMCAGTTLVNSASGPAWCSPWFPSSEPWWFTGSLCPTSSTTQDSLSTVSHVIRDAFINSQLDVFTVISHQPITFRYLTCWTSFTHSYRDTSELPLLVCGRFMQRDHKSLINCFWLHHLMCNKTLVSLSFLRLRSQHQHVRVTVWNQRLRERWDAPTAGDPVKVWSKDKEHIRQTKSYWLCIWYLVLWITNIWFWIHFF